MEENQTTVIDINATDDNDSEGSGLTYSLTGGADQGLFTLDSSTGVLTFTNPPDFETPGDANGDNDYLTRVTVTDSAGLTADQDLIVTVTDVAENTAPTITTGATVSVEENQTTVIDINATDDNDSEGSGLTYSLTGGADQGLFTLDSSTGVLTFTNPPDFETPGDANGDNDYLTQVTVTDSAGLTAVQDLTVTVTNEQEDEPLTLIGTFRRDTLIGGNNDDFISGHFAKDTLIGNGGNDTIFGGFGGDTISGGEGNDTISGGFGRDTFVLTAGEGTDIITDFRNNDLIGLADGLSISDLTLSGNDIIVAASNEILANLTGVDTATLNESDFTII